ncbi:MAG: manganese efflux pump MntP family protein [Bacteroidales bacterium]|nr:manganese efflux pump MntP family protein [Bacteroidales bacterium]
MSIWESILLAASLCADCLAVSLCSGVTLRSVRWREILGVALAFAVIQAGLLLAGWAFGYFFVGLVEKISHIIAFLLLLYVGGSMLIEGIKGEAEVRDLSSWRNIILGGLATSIDALAVGVAQSMEGADWPAFLPLLVAVFVITALSVVVGLRGGRAIGARFGRWAEIVGGVVLIAIGVSVLV